MYSVPIEYTSIQQTLYDTNMRWHKRKNQALKNEPYFCLAEISFVVRRIFLNNIYFCCIFK